MGHSTNQSLVSFTSSRISNIPRQPIQSSPPNKISVVCLDSSCSSITFCSTILTFSIWRSCLMLSWLECRHSMTRRDSCLMTMSIPLLKPHLMPLWKAFRCRTTSQQIVLILPTSLIKDLMGWWFRSWIPYGWMCPLLFPSFQSGLYYSDCSSTLEYLYFLGSTRF